MIIKILTIECKYSSLTLNFQLFLKYFNFSYIQVFSPTSKP